MKKTLVINLEDCTDYQRTLSANPVLLAHGTLLVLSTLMLTVTFWLSSTRADLIVVATGQVRSAQQAQRVFTGEQFNAATGGRVVEVGFEQGQQVKKDQVLIRFDTSRIDNQIAKLDRRTQSDRDAIEELVHLERTQSRQYESRLAKAQAELDQAKQQVDRAQRQRELKINLATVELQESLDRLTWTKRLHESNAASPRELRQVELETQRKRNQLEAAQLSVDASAVAVRDRAIEAIRREFDVRLQEMRLQRSERQAQLQQTLHDLANLQLEREQAVVAAKSDGVVISKEPKVGDVLKPGQAVAQIAPGHEFRMDVTLASRDIGHIQVGMPVKVKLDAYDYQQYGAAEGEVVFVSPDTQEANNDPNAPPTYIARISLADHEIGRDEKRGQIKMGMTGRVEIITGHENLLSVLVRKIRRTISLS